MSEDDLDRYHSKSVDAAAIRWAEQHPDQELEASAPSDVPEAGGVVPNHHSASAEAAALRWQEQHPDEDE